MKFHLGANPEKPTIAARVSHDELGLLAESEFYTKAYAKIKRLSLLAVTETSEGKDIALLLRKIGRRPVSVRDLYTESTVSFVRELTKLPDESDAALKNIHMDTSRLTDNVRLP